MDEENASHYSRGGRPQAVLASSWPCQIDHSKKSVEAGHTGCSDRSAEQVDLMEDRSRLMEVEGSQDMDSMHRHVAEEEAGLDHFEVDNYIEVAHSDQLDLEADHEHHTTLVLVHSEQAGLPARVVADHLQRIAQKLVRRQLARRQDETSTFG